MGALDEFERLTTSILAAEDWAEAYSNAPKQHAQLIRQTAKMNRQVMVYFRDLAKDAPKLVNWFNYSSAVYEQQRTLKASSAKAYDVNVVVNQNEVQQQDQAFIKLVFNTIATTAELGVQSLVVEHNLPIGPTSTSTLIQNQTTEQLANLVGMKIMDKGLPTEHLVPNPNTAYSIDETTRSRIANSIKTSIQLGEDQTQATERLMDVIADTDRADMIARTETVRAYNNGRRLYALSSGAVAHMWQNFGASDICVTNTADGWIPIDQAFASGALNVPTHPRDKCIVIFSYDSSHLTK